MKEALLQSYANSNLLDYEGGNEEFTYLVETSEELLDQITNKNIASFALAAINPHVSIDNAQLKSTQIIIHDKWKLFSKDTKNTDIRRTVLRTIILNSLDNIIENDNTKAAIIWLSCQHIIKYIMISNSKEEGIILELIQKAGKRYENLAKGNFQIIAPKFDFDLAKISSVRLPVNKDRSASEIESKLLKIEDIQQESFTDRYSTERYSITPSHFKKWYEDFSKILSVSLDEMTTGERKSIKKYLLEIDSELQKAFNILTKVIPEKIESSLYSVSNNNTLIWWKETLFSKTLQDSYRNVPSLVQVISMAYDLANELNGCTPISVNFFLNETLLKVETEEKKITLSNLSVEILSQENKDYLSDILTEKDLDVDTSLSLIEFLSAKYQNQTVGDITTTVGVKGEQELTYNELIVWLFHDFQAIKLAHNGQ